MEKVLKIVVKSFGFICIGLAVLAFINAFSKGGYLLVMAGMYGFLAYAAFDSAKDDEKKEEAK